MSVLAMSRPKCHIRAMVRRAATSSSPSAASLVPVIGHGAAAPPTNAPLAVCSEIRPERPCRPWRSKRTTSRKVRPAAWWMPVGAASTPQLLAHHAGGQELAHEKVGPAPDAVGPIVAGKLDDDMVRGAARAFAHGRELREFQAVP